MCVCVCVCVCVSVYLHLYPLVCPVCPSLTRTFCVHLAPSSWLPGKPSVVKLYSLASCYLLRCFSIVFAWLGSQTCTAACTTGCPTSSCCKRSTSGTFGAVLSPSRTSAQSQSSATGQTTHRCAIMWRCMKALRHSSVASWNCQSSHRYPRP